MRNRYAPSFAAAAGAREQGEAEPKRDAA